MACYIYYYRYFLQKSKITFGVAIFGELFFSEGSLLSGFATPAKFYRYFRRVVTSFGTLR